ncbi:putative succinate-semialdehyde dehydrogenase [Penicillium brevicompactum]|uniref:putative succinate-semialdehyde dehydrogenase n=1 Tax=Penicillium brevicompactum TaxID=5074 RepID=UPI00253F854B|nr:putative succinate-semialdehyde dehydrogenase [Penicillium brevicompactum]KAJ5336749.1 putative succinate-semialdehyde dehydrogenase [Penicillium brevicompactum]
MTPTIYNPTLTIVKPLFLQSYSSYSGLIYSHASRVSYLELIGGNSRSFLAVVSVDIFQCQSVTYIYHKNIPGRKCMDQDAFYISTAALDLIS